MALRLKNDTPPDMVMLAHSLLWLVKGGSCQVWKISVHNTSRFAGRMHVYALDCLPTWGDFSRAWATSMLCCAVHHIQTLTVKVEGEEGKMKEEWLPCTTNKSRLASADPTHAQHAAGGITQNKNDILTHALMTLTRVISGFQDPCGLWPICLQAYEVEFYTNTDEALIWVRF